MNNETLATRVASVSAPPQDIQTAVQNRRSEKEPSMNAIPTPAIFANKKVAPLPAPPKPVTLAKIEPTDPGKIVRPGLTDQVIDLISDGVVKTKHLKRGQRVRPFVHGEARGSERVVASVTRVDDGATVRVEWATPHPTSEHKAAYRWYDASLDGATVQHVIKAPALVAYEEV